MKSLFAIFGLIAFACATLAALYVFDPQIFSEVTVRTADGEVKTDRLKIFVGLAAVVAIILGGWRSYTAQKQATAAAEQARIALENHVTGIFAKSVELLSLVREVRSVDDSGKDRIEYIPTLETRLGALYSLERILAESKKDQRAILETLCAYIRENSTFETPPTSDQLSTTRFQRGQLPPAKQRRTDVQAALTIIGRRPEQVRHRIALERWKLDLRNTNLIGYDLSDLNFDRADFTGSFLDEANFSNSSVRAAIFDDIFLRNANLKNANFNSSLFQACDFGGTKIEATTFVKCVFKNSDPRNGVVSSVDISGADLSGAFDTSYLEHLMELFKTGAPRDDVFDIQTQDLRRTAEFFQKAKWDKETKLDPIIPKIITFVDELNRLSP